MHPHYLTLPCLANNLPHIFLKPIQDTIKINVDKSVVHAGAFGTIGIGGGVAITGATVATTGGCTPTSSGAISANGGGAGGLAPSMVPRMSPALVLLDAPMTTGRTWAEKWEKIQDPGDSSRDLFGMVKTWRFQGVKWPPTRGWKGHFESPGSLILGGTKDGRAWCSWKTQACWVRQKTKRHDFPWNTGSCDRDPGIVLL